MTAYGKRAGRQDPRTKYTKAVVEAWVARIKEKGHIARKEIVAETGCHLSTISRKIEEYNAGMLL